MNSDVCASPESPSDPLFHESGLGRRIGFSRIGTDDAFSAVFGGVEWLETCTPTRVTTWSTGPSEVGHEGDTMRQPSDSPTRLPWRRLFPLLLLILGLVLLATDHFVHALGFLPYAILLLCPIMHFLGHGGHHRSAPPASEDNPR